MLVVVALEHRQHIFHILFAPGIVRECALHKAPHAVAYHIRIYPQSMLRKTKLAQGIIGSLRKVVDGIQERSVEVENHISFHRAKLWKNFHNLNKAYTKNK